jgi:hypothetical protein
MTIKKIKAYEVNGTLYKNKKEAEKEEARQKMIQERSRLATQLEEICKKLGVESPLKPTTSAGSIAAPVGKPVPKFKVGDRVIAETCEGKKSGVVAEYTTTNTGYMQYRVTLDSGRNVWCFEDTMELAEQETAKPKFKNGDKVYYRGRPAKFEGYSFDGLCCSLTFSDNKEPKGTYGVSEESLVKAEDQKPKFKAGDKVRLTKSFKIGKCSLKKGSKGCVLTYYHPKHILVCVNDKDFYATENNIELVNDELKKSKKVVGKR